MNLHNKRLMFGATKIVPIVQQPNIVSDQMLLAECAETTLRIQVFGKTG